MPNALVPLAPRDQQPTRAAGVARGNADFIAHLIATATTAPQTRHRRRATIREATSVYETLDRRPGIPGRALSRSL